MDALLCQFKLKQVTPKTVLFTLATILLSACSSNLNQAPLEPEASPSITTPAAQRIGDVQIGAYVRGAVWNHKLLYEVEDSIGHEFDIIQWFSSWPTVFETNKVNELVAIGRTPLITWQSSLQSLDSIAAGTHDAYIRSWAREVKKVNGDVYLRPFPEMNGDWTNWNGEPEKLIKAWRHIVTVFRNADVENVKWVWSPNITDEPRTPENRMELYYPGDDYVDVMGLSGYNWGTVRTYTAWKSFEETYEVPYERLTKVATHPIWLAELASTELGGDKAQWIKDMLSSTKFPQIGAIIWFNENKETDWRIESSVASENAFKEWFMQARLETSIGFNP